MVYLAHKDQDTQRTQSLLEHLTNTAELACGFAERFGAGEAAYRCGMLHDIGKYSSSFQRRLNGEAIRVDHSTAGAIEACQLHDFAAALCIAGHHGGLPDMGGKADSPDSQDTSTLNSRIKRRPGNGIDDYSAFAQEITIPDAQPPKVLVSESWSAFFYTHMLYSCLVDADWLDTERFMQNGAVQRSTGEALALLSQKLDSYISKWWGTSKPLNIRRCEILRALISAGENAPGLYTLTVPTGGGKTVGSMAFALRHALKNSMRRIIYVIPYTSIIEQTQDVFENIFGAQSVVAHYANITYNTDENGNISDANRRRYLACENWDAPIILTTAVQFFESLFGYRSSSCRKLHNIAGSVIIFDEAQMLPVNYLLACLRAIKELTANYGCTAVLCTATQPSLAPLLARPPAQTAQELCPNAGENYDFFRRVRYKYDGVLTDAELAERLSGEKQTLCIVNNRKQAQALFRLLPPEGSFHLSSTMTAEHRRRILAVIRSRLKSGMTCRVVSTSLVECGVDVDFPCVYRAIAGLDSIIQAGGRCNREGERSAEDSVVHIFDPEAKPPRALEQNIAATRSVIERFDDIASPEAISAYFSFLLYTLKGENALDEKGIMRLISEQLAFRTVAQHFHLIESSAYTIYIPFGDGKPLTDKLLHGISGRALMRKLGPYAVSVYEQDYKRLDAIGAVERFSDNSAVLLRTELYDEQIGLLLSPEGGEALFG